MKNLFFLFLITICFVLDVSAQEKRANENENIQTVDYCELRKNPNLYNGKMIRVHGIYERSFEVSAFYDAACIENPKHLNYETWVNSFGTKLSCVDKKTADVLETFIYGSSTSEAEVTLIGKFFGGEKSGGFGHLNGYKFQINVSCFEQAKLLPTEKYGCVRVDDTKPFHFLSYVKTEITEAPNYENNSKKPKKEKLVWIRLNNNSSCSITVPTALDNAENQTLEDQSKVPVIYELSSRCTTKKSRIISERKQTLSALPSGKSIYFAVPLKYLTEQPFDVRVSFGFLTQKADSYYQPYYFSQYDLPESLRKDIDCRKF